MDQDSIGWWFKSPLVQLKAIIRRHKKHTRGASISGKIFHINWKQCTFARFFFEKERQTGCYASLISDWKFKDRKWFRPISLIVCFCRLDVHKTRLTIDGMQLMTPFLFKRSKTVQKFNFNNEWHGYWTVSIDFAL